MVLHSRIMVCRAVAAPLQIRSKRRAVRCCARLQARCGSVLRAPASGVQRAVARVCGHVPGAECARRARFTWIRPASSGTRPRPLRAAVISASWSLRPADGGRPHSRPICGSRVPPSKPTSHPPPLAFVPAADTLRPLRRPPCCSSAGAPVNVAKARAVAVKPPGSPSLDVGSEPDRRRCVVVTLTARVC